MAVETQPPLVVPGSARRDAGDVRRLQPGWPLAIAFIGYPVWWILGVGEFVLFAAAAFMAYDLLHRRDIKAPRGFGLWILFLVWVAAGFLVLQVDAPGAEPGASANRYFVWGFRLAWFLAATIVLLYVGNNREQLSTQRVTRIMSWMFLVITIGGLVGSLVPSVTFPSVLELLLPHRISSIGFLNAQIHPTLAQVYDVQRPSAPFPYANEWGLNFACFLPFFVASWCHRDAGWRRVAAPFVLVLAVIPVIYSLNRGLWLTLAVMAVFVAVRSAGNGHLRLLGALMVSAIAVAVLVTASPLHGMLESRVSQEDTSNEGRTNLVSLSLESMGQKSPVVGYGTTRDVQGTFGSISGGATVTCPLCSPPAMGTQGLLWLVAFSTGIGGLIMFLGFFVQTLFRHLRLRSVNATLGLSVIVALFVTLPIYDLSGPALFAVMAAAGLLWRDSVAQQTAGQARGLAAREPNLRSYGALVLRHRGIVAACVLAGIIAGAGWQASRTATPTATVSLLVPTVSPAVTASMADPDPDRVVARADTLDTEAQLASDQSVRSAITLALQRAGLPVRGTLAISATANSRILHLSYTGPNAEAARTGVTEAARAYIASKLFSVRHERTQTLNALDARSTALEKAIRILDRKARIAPTTVSSRTLRAHLMTRSQEVAYQIQQVTVTPLEAGRVVSETTVRTKHDGWVVAIASGGLLGLLLGISFGQVASRRRRGRARHPYGTRQEWRAGNPVFAVDHP